MDTRKRNISLRAKILLAGVVILCILIICACAIIGFQVYQVNIKQYDRTSSQQFSLIEQTIMLFMQNNKNTAKVLAEHPIVQVADTSLNNYTTTKRKFFSDQNGAGLPVRGMIPSARDLIRESVYGINKRKLPVAIPL